MQAIAEVVISCLLRIQRLEVRVWNIFGKYTLLAKDNCLLSDHARKKNDEKVRALQITWQQTLSSLDIFLQVT